MNPPVCLEIVGPPGSGKTSLARELTGRHPVLLLGVPPDWRRLQHVPFFLRNGLALAPALLPKAFGSRSGRLSSEEISDLIWLRGWHRRLANGRTGGGIVVLDQGPIFMLSELLFFHGPQAAELFSGPSWGRAFTAWQNVLSGIVRLDASDEVLARRISARDKGHIIKDADLPRARQFLARSRVALDRAKDMLGRGARPPVIMEFDTGRQTLGEVVEALAGELGANLTGRPGPR